MQTEFIDKFIINFNDGIRTIYKVNFKNNKFEDILPDLKFSLEQEYLNLKEKGLSFDDINSQLFYYVNFHIKNLSKPLESKTISYICPCCLFFNKQTILIEKNNLLNCNECFSKLKTESVINNKLLYSAYYKHNKSGFKCKDCERFIPKSISNKTEIICPFPDCCFVGDASSLKKMKHPVAELECFEESNDNKIVVNSSSNLYKKIIEEQSNQLAYSSNNFNLKHKLFVYQAFNNLLDRFPSEMTDYLNGSRTGGFQHKVFQEYISILENSLPIIISKNKKNITIDNLLDPNLCLFDGISTFEGVVDSNLVIKNGTKEYYIGGRKASYTKPYYIGKILSILDKKDKQPITHLVKEYSFLKIKMNNIKPNTEVIVTHLRVPPHYQMGGMVHVNRIRKNIVDHLKKL